MIATILETLIGVIILFGAPVLAAYSLIKRNKSMKEGEVGFIYNGKKWVAWLWVICFFAHLFLIFIAPLGKAGYSPEWQHLKTLLMSLVFYVSYALVSYRSATPEEIEKAKAEGENVLELTTSAAKSTFSIIMSCLMGVLAVLPFLLHQALNPVLAVKEINGVVYKLIGSSIHMIGGGVFVLGLIFIIIFITIYVASALLAIFGTMSIAVIAIGKYFINMKKSQQ